MYSIDVEVTNTTPNQLKQQVVDVEPDRLAVMFKALGHPARLRIFARLAARCTPGAATQADCFRACVGDIASNLGIAPSTVSHHMKELRQAGLIRMERGGKAVECWAEPEVVGLIGNLEEHLRNLGRDAFVSRRRSS